MSGFILYILALTMASLLTPIGVIYKMGSATVSAIKRKTKRWKHFEIEMSFYFRDLALSLDQYGNVFLAPMMNHFLIMGTEKYLFGHPDHTISLVLAKNLMGINYGKDIKLTYVGKFIVWAVRKIDPGHFFKTLKNPENN